MLIKRIKRLTESEFKQLLQLHLESLNESFINRFGKCFLKISYKTIIPSSNNICLIVIEKNRLIGFLIATFDRNRFLSEVICKNFWQLSLEILKTSILKPVRLWYLVVWFLTKFHREKLVHELQFIAISPTYRNKGLGKSLLLFLNQKYKRHNIPFYLTGTKANNKLSNNFYIKNGFTFYYQEKFFGETFNYYLSHKLF